MRGGVHLRCVGVHVCLQRCAYVVSCRYGGLEVKFAVHCCCGEDFADAFAHLVHFLVGGGKGVLQGWAQAHAPEDSVDGVLPAGEGLLWPGRGVYLCVEARPDLCVAGGMAQIQGAAAVDGWRRLIHWDRQSMATQVVAGLTRGDLGQGVCRGLVPRLEETPEDPVWGGGFPHRPGGCVPWGEHGVGPPQDPWAIWLWAAGGRGGHYVMVPRSRTVHQTSGGARPLSVARGKRSSLGVWRPVARRAVSRLGVVACSHCSELFGSAG